MDKSVRLLIAEDQPLVRIGLQHLLGLAQKFTIIGHATTLIEAYRLCQELQPDMLLIASNLLPFPTRPTLIRLREEYPQMKLLLLIEEQRGNNLHDLLHTGVSGYILKNDSTETVITATHTIADGGQFFSPAVSSTPYMPTAPALKEVAPVAPVLTSREMEIVNLLSKGFDNRTIARELDLAYQTVRNRLSVIYEKLGIQSRAEAILWAIQQRNAAA